MRPRDALLHLASFSAGCVLAISFLKLWKIAPTRSQQLLRELQHRRESTEYALAENPMSVVEERVVIAMVGLPARGKSYISKALVRYLKFLGCPVKLFNAGDKRRDRGKSGANAKFFDPDNTEAHSLKERMALETLDDLLEWLRTCKKGCACGIFDATNTTVARRKAVAERCAREKSLRLVFVESICDDPEVLANNYRMKLGNADYKGADADRATEDFMERVRAYEKVYERITDEEGECYSDDLPMIYVQMVDAGRKLVAARCRGMVMNNTLPMLQAIHLRPRKLFIVLAGQSENDKVGVRGGDSPLSQAGKVYAHAAWDLLLTRERPDVSVRVLRGTLRRYGQTTDILKEKQKTGDSKLRTYLKMRALDELCFGSLEGLPGGKLGQSFPEEYRARQADKLRYRYPGAGGGSYLDLIRGMGDVVLMTERIRDDVIIVCDVAAARVLLSYYIGKEHEEVPELPVAPGIIELIRSHSGFDVKHLPVTDGDASMLAT